ncbi:MAG TPA: polysaccharide biosynthesis protein, partial [Gaiellaceae bacterium]|nr:polysaccharide biosynthesis protein [Gaiellaceae bacterium]
DLARDMIRLSGREPDRDIPIQFIGVRAGEKLHEELWGQDEQVAETGHPKIQRARRVPITASWLDEELTVLERLVRDGETLEAVSRLSTMVKAPVRGHVPAAEPERVTDF